MLMATLVSIGGQGAKAQLVSADYRKFAQCELANAWVFDGCQRTSAGAKNWCDRNTAGNVVFGENVVLGEEGVSDRVVLGHRIRPGHLILLSTPHGYIVSRDGG